MRKPGGIKSRNSLVIFTDPPSLTSCWVGLLRLL